MIDLEIARRAFATLLALTFTGQALQAQPAPRQPASPGVAEVGRFLDASEARLEALSREAGRAAWVMVNFITVDTQALAAVANERYLAAATEIAREAARFRDVDLDPATARRLDLIGRAFVLPPPADPAALAELARLEAQLEAAYGAAEHCRTDGTCLNIDQLSDVIETSRNPAELEAAWRGWHDTGTAMRSDYLRLIDIAGRGARDLGYSDLGALWRSGYDMDEAELARQVDRLWKQVEPLYRSLHCYVRARLVEHYGADVVSPNGPIPAHLLGNMWAQGWENVFPLVAPAEADPGYDLGALLVEHGVDELQMVRYGESFFTSLGLEPLPQTFWERSLFLRPTDRDVVCHASAWNLDDEDDLRIKMCIQVGAEDFVTIHHELGHNMYQRAYKHQPFLFRDSAHDGFHEALGDVVALSITPDYLVEIGLLAAAPPPLADLGFLLRQALEHVAFFPFGVSMDRWRWQLFSGEIPATEANAGWWRVRRELQGVAPPVVRSEADFDPAAKFHIPGNTPYTRYFLARILQYQLHRGLCQATGEEGPLHRCSLYGSQEAGRRLSRLMAMGASRPWPDALDTAIGERSMDAAGVLEYYAPLAAWLDDQNRGRTCGWSAP